MPTPEQIDLLRGGQDAFNRRNLQDFLAVVRPDVELYPLRALLEGEPYRGYEGVKRFFKDIYDDWSELEVSLGDLHDIDGGVLGVGSLRGRGRHSGLEFESPIAWVYKLEDGKVRELRVKTDVNGALKEFGIA